MIYLSNINCADNLIKKKIIDPLSDFCIIAAQSFKLFNRTLMFCSIKDSFFICADNAIAALAAEIDAVDHKFNNSFRGTSRERRRSQSKGRADKSGKDWCWYHRRFKSKATKCNTPCTYLLIWPLQPVTGLGLS